MSKIRLILPLTQAALAVVLKAHSFLGPDLPSRPAWQKADNQLCDAWNAPATLVREGLIWLASRAECLLIPVRLRPEAPCCWGYLSYPVDLLIRTILYFGLVWLLWYAASIEIGGGGRSLLAPRTGMRTVADIFAVLLGASLIAFGLAVRSGFRAPSTYWNAMATPYYMWGILFVIFYGHDLRRSFRSSQNAV